ncbi:hypothetical protein EV361DRAFT_928513 [Lentinula raphanica]|nr:hypothetical protein EV361DRAFT_928513 [Lentinula raphanica]
MSVAFSLSEFTELVSSALEIDTSFDSKLSTFTSFPPSPPSYPTANAKPFSSLPLTSKSSTSSPRVLRKIKSLLTHGAVKFNQSELPLLPSPESLKSSWSEPLTASSDPSSRLKPIPTVSLLNQKAQRRTDAALFVPYLPLADRHERFGSSASIFSRHGSDCGSSIVPPSVTTDCGRSVFSKLPTPPRSPTYRRASLSSLVSYPQSSVSSFCGNADRVLNSAPTMEIKHSSSSSCDTNSSFQSHTHPSSKSSLHSSALDTSDSDPFAKGRVQVVTRRLSAGSSVGNSSVYSSNIIHPFSSCHPAQSNLMVPKQGSFREETATVDHHSVTSSALTTKSSQRRKGVSPPKQKPAPTGPLPLPPRSKPPRGPLPPIPSDSSCSSSVNSGNSLPSPPNTPPGSAHGAPPLPRRKSERDWTLGLPYSSDEDIRDLRRTVYGPGLSRSKEVIPRRKSIGQVTNKETHLLPRPQQSSKILPLAQRRTDLKPMGHRRKGSPFPLTLAPPSSDSSPSISNEIPRGSSAAHPLANFPPSRFSLSSSESDDPSDDELHNAHRRREVMAREPAGMILDSRGLPVPLPNPLPSKNPSVNPFEIVTSISSEPDDDMDTPMQSPTTPTSGHFLIAQTRQAPVVHDHHISSNLNSFAGKVKPRQPVPECIVMMTLDPFEDSDSESLTSGEDTTYWSARSSMDSSDDPAHCHSHVPHRRWV